jgi:hypothetical protein
MTIHLITEIMELRYATSGRAFGPDKKPQFLGRLEQHTKAPGIVGHRGHWVNPDLGRGLAALLVSTALPGQF